MSETTPLLADVTSRTKDVYDRFSSVQKQAILMGVSLTVLFTPLASACFLPCVRDVAKDLKTTGTIINYTVGAYLFTVGIGNLIWAPYTRFYGRRPVYLASLPMICVGSLGASISVNVLQLTISRTVQAFGTSCMICVGAAAISDMYRLEERGTAMGVFFGTYLFGPALGALLGGIFSVYASWRAIQFVLFAFGFLALVCISMFLPETSHPGTRGVDTLLAEELDAGIAVTPRVGHRLKWVWVDPFKPLITLLRSPNIFFVSLAGSFTMMTVYVLAIPLSYTLGPRYGIINPALIGLCFFPSGIGQLGATVGGRFSDRAVVKGLKKRNGKWVPEDRLHATLPGALLLVPLSVLSFGLTTQFVRGRWGLVINLVCLFINGVGVDVVLAPAATYGVDILRHRSAEVIAVNAAMRNTLGAVASAGVLPMINSIGIGATNGIAAVVAWLGFGLLLVTIRYGDRLRAWIDIGYTNTLLNA